MTNDSPWAARLRDQLAAGEQIAWPAEAEARIEALLGDAWNAAVASWPSVVAHADAWIAHVALQLGELSAAETLAPLCLVDLALAAACAAGDAAALSAFDAIYTPEIVRVAARTRIGAAADDLKQVLWERWFVSTEERGPRIATYSGRGTLRAWVRISAVHAALRLARSAATSGDGQSAEPETLDLIESSFDVELQILRQTYVPAFNAVLQRALLALSDRDRNLLRYHYGRGLNIDQLGVLYGVHRATVARWIVRAQEMLHDDIKRSLMQQFSLAREELEQLVRMIQSRLEIDLQALDEG